MVSHERESQDERTPTSKTAAANTNEGEFRRGMRYKRRELHDKYGGQRQGGISTPQDHPLIFLFHRKNHIPTDGWTSEGLFHFTGEGRKGDMEWKAGNKSLQNHKKSNKRVYLFLAGENKTGFVTCIGEMQCAGFDLRTEANSSGEERQVIVFRLEPCGWKYKGPATAAAVRQKRKLEPAKISPKKDNTKAQKELKKPKVSEEQDTTDSPPPNDAAQTTLPFDPAQSSPTVPPLLSVYANRPIEPDHLYALVAESLQQDKRAERMDACVGQLIATLTQDALGEARFVLQ